MLAWVVINRQQPRQFTTKSSSPCTLCLCVKLSGSFPPSPVVSIRYARFLSRRRVYPPRGLHGLSPTPYALSPFLSHSCALFCTQQNLNSIVFNRFRTLCPKHPGVRYPSSWFNVAKRHGIQGRMTLWP